MNRSIWNSKLTLGISFAVISTVGFTYFLSGSADLASKTKPPTVNNKNQNFGKRPLELKDAVNKTSKVAD